MIRPCGKLAWALAAGLLGSGGCVEPCPQTLVPLTDVLAEYNANADAVERLWARATMSVTLDAPNAPAMTWRSGSPTCLLLLRKGRDRLGPHDFVLIGRETAAVELFRLGSSTAQGMYYFWYRFGERGKAWSARHGAASGPRLPIDPAQVLSVLAVCALPDDPDKLPAVAVGMRNVPGDCAYVLTVIDRDRGSGRLRFKREVLFRWTKEGPRRPYRVHVFDEAGRRVMTAHLKDYRPIDVSDLDDPPDREPSLPTDIEIVCHDVGGVQAVVRRIHLVLSEMTAEDKWDRSACDFKPPAGVAPAAMAAPARSDDGDGGSTR